MNKIACKIMLVDDDADDCVFFKEAIQELPFFATIVTLHNGVELLERLSNPLNEIPDILFLDLNMPRKTGFECLFEIRQLSRLEDMPIVIFSTSLDATIAEALREKGANHYIRKPDKFSDLRSVIMKTLTMLLQRETYPFITDEFIIKP